MISNQIIISAKNPLPKISYVRLGLLMALLWSLPANAQTQAMRDGQVDNDYQIGAVLWQQSAAETKALQLQAYSLARLMLERDLRIRRRLRQKRAVVVDVDETVLDNTRYQAFLIVNHQSFSPQSWQEWCNRAEATAIPGAVEFLTYAASRGVRIFYVTNRSEAEKAGTIRNLKQVGFPQVSDESVLVRSTESSKEERRLKISHRYRIVLLCGDNLADFSKVFEGKTQEERATAVRDSQRRFGTQFIVLPNPMYGDWESAIYGKSRLNEREKGDLRKAALKAFMP